MASHIVIAEGIFTKIRRWSVFWGGGKEEAVHRSEVIRSTFYEFRGKSKEAA